MKLDERLLHPRFPRANRYHPDWVEAGASGGANALWLVEWLTERLELRPGMRVLDLGCGRAATSIFLRREYGVEVWAADLWFDPSENLQRIRDAGVASGVFPLRVEARSLPFGSGFFDAIVSIDSFPYYGTDDFYLGYLARFLAPGGALGIAGSGMVREVEGEVPEHLRGWWEPALWCLHSAAWWRRHWEKTGIVDVVAADTIEDGWKLWLQWQRVVAPDNTVELQAVEADAGRTLGYLRVVARLRADARIDDPVTSISIPASYTKAPLLRPH